MAVGTETTLVNRLAVTQQGLHRPLSGGIPQFQGAIHRAGDDTGIRLVDVEECWMEITIRYAPTVPGIHPQDLAILHIPQHARLVRRARQKVPVVLGELAGRDAAGMALHIQNLGRRVLPLRVFLHTPTEELKTGFKLTTLSLLEIFAQHPLFHKGSLLLPQHTLVVANIEFICLPGNTFFKVHKVTFEILLHLFISLRQPLNTFELFALLVFSI